MYADSASATPKKYSYAEWAHFLKLLGEDESDSSLHKAPRSPSEAAGEDILCDERDDDQDHDSPRQKDFETGGQQIAQRRPGSKNEDEKLESWSWIGSRSPLMGDKTEAEWLLEKLFQRLEESLHDLKMAKEDDAKRETADPHRSRPSTANGREGNSLTGESFSPNRNQLTGKVGNKG